MSIIRAVRDRWALVSYVWSERRSEDDGGVTDDVAMIGIMVACALGVSAFLVPWIADKISTIDVGW